MIDCTQTGNDTFVASNGMDNIHITRVYDDEQECFFLLDIANEDVLSIPAKEKEDINVVFALCDYILTGDKGKTPIIH